MSKYVAMLLFTAICGFAGAQADSTKRIKSIFSGDDIVPLKGTSLRERIDSLLNPELRISGYVSTYFAYYDDDAENSGFNLFPTLAPRSNQFSLNMALINMTYRSRAERYNITLHYGDVPESAWPATFNLIQEANAGFKLARKWWFDAGFFKTHIGLESFQPRENLTSSMSVPNFYDPYFLSGAKITWLTTQKLTLQAGVFNGYNEYLDNNRDKAVTLTANYNFNRHVSLTYNFLTCDESPDGSKAEHRRYYNNAFCTFIFDKINVGLDANLGWQQNSLLRDSTKFAMVYGAVAVVRYVVFKKVDVYGRGEYFSDPDRILTGSLDIGRYIRGVTAGISYRPRRTAEVSFEWRLLQAKNRIFTRKGRPLTDRDEFSVCLDLWF